LGTHLSAAEATRGALTVACLQDRGQLDRLEPEWGRLLQSSDVASPFLTFGWQVAWLDTYGRGRALQVLTARREDTLVGLWPLTLIRRGAFRVLEPVGAGRSDWLDVLTTRDDRPNVLAAFLGYVADCRRTWDLLECRDVLDTSPSLAAFAPLCAAAGLRVRREIRTVAPHLVLRGSWEAFLGTKRPKFRSNLKYYQRLAERNCPQWTIRHHHWREGDDVVNRLAQVELRSWKASAGNLKISTVTGREFYRRFCSYFAARGELDLWLAHCEGGLIAFLINIRYGSKIYHYNTCFDERHGQISPGLLLHSQAIQEGFRQQLAEYDFLSGDEPYKDRWCSEKRPIHHVAFYSPSLRSRAAFVVLVRARWVFRKSKTLRAARERLLALTHRFRRRAAGAVTSAAAARAATPLRVAVVSSVHRWNDTRVYIRETRSLVAAGFDVLLVAVAAEHQSFESDGVRVLPLPRRKPLLRWLNALTILRATVRHRAQVVHAHDPELFPLTILLRLLGMRAICDVHEDLAQQILHKEWIPRGLRAGLSRTTRIAMKLLPRLVDSVILAEDAYVRSFPPAANVTVVRNFPLLPPSCKSDYRAPSFRLVYVGDVRIVRGIETYIRITGRLAAREVPVELWIVGSFASTDEELRMHALVQELKLSDQVHWLGRRPPQEVPQLLNRCDVGLALLHPIGNYCESYPTKMFEYMAAGIPAVVSNFQLWESVLAGNDCGRVVDPLDIDAGVRVLLDYWNDPVTRERQGRNGRRAVVEHYQWHTEGRKLLEVYQQLRIGRQRGS
jgi:CelD/BcsL family acetyltransferase involved in cellulose biosynthesis/glycosyltransferase involved in cell wall biosynthesis